MKSEFTKETMKLSIKYNLLSGKDDFIEESLEKLSLQNKVPIKISRINSEVLGMIYSSKSKALKESQDG